jgi:hypothetical protein
VKPLPSEIAICQRIAVSVPHRRGRNGVASGLVVAAATAVLITGAGVADAHCVSMANVHALAGTVTLAVGATATGTDPSSDGSETVYLAHAANQVTLRLDHKSRFKFNGHVVVLYTGIARGGTAIVDDSVENTGLDASAKVEARGAVGGGGSIGGVAAIAINRSVCEYKLVVSFEGTGTFSGDTLVADGLAVSWGADSRAHAVPANLKFHGSEAPKVVAKCPDIAEAPPEGSCADMQGPWLVDLITLDQCGSLDRTNCTPNDENAFASASAIFSWNLKPVFRKR